MLNPHGAVPDQKTAIKGDFFVHLARNFTNKTKKCLTVCLEAECCSQQVQKWV